MDKSITTSKTERPEAEYVKPQISDYGDLKELTENRATAGITDSPRYTPGPTVFC